MKRTFHLAAPVLALLLAAPAPAQTITSRVLPPPGSKAVAPDKVQVELISLTPGFRQAVRRLQGGPPPILSTVRPRPDGSFAITAPEPGHYRVVVRADGFVPMRCDLSPLVEEIELPPVELRPAAAFEVQVLGPDGKPVPALPVQTVPLSEPGESSTPWQPAGKIEITGADGRVNALSAPGARLWVLAFATRFSFPQVEVRERSVTLRLKAAKRVDLEVRDARGKKVAGALVRFANFLMPLGLTGPDGRLSLPLDEDMNLVVETEDGQTAAFRLGVGTPSPCVVELSTPTTVSGRVLEAAGRVPVPEALVWGDHGMLSLRATRTAADGRFQIRVPGELPTAELLAAAPGYLSERSTVPLHFEGGASSSATLLLPAASFLAGRVVDTGGRPVAEARIQIDNPPFRGPTGRQFRSGPDGSFRLPYLRGGETYQLWVRKEGFAPFSVFAATPQRHAPAAPVHIVLARGGAVLGQTVDSNGEPVAGATVELHPWGDRVQYSNGRYEPATGTATSGADGKFEVRDMPPGLFVLQARGGGFAPGFLRGIAVAAGTPRVDAGTVILSPEAVLEGQVTDPRGAPVAGAAVRTFLERQDDGFSLDRSLKTGADGRFHIDGLPQRSRVRVGVQAQGYGIVELAGVELPLPAPLRIQLRPLIQLTGKVVNPAGEPVAGASLSLIRRSAAGDSAGSGAGSADAQGRFRIGFEPGPVEIKASAEGYVSSTWRGTVPERGEAGPVEITLERGAVLEGRVLDPAGNPVADASLFTSPQQLSWESPIGASRHAESDADGRYRITGLGTGLHRVEARSKENDPGEVSSQLEVQPGVNRLDLTLDMGVEVSGVVRDAEGTPVAGAGVRLSPVKSGRSFGGLSSPDGSFRFHVVTGGLYRITALHRTSGFARQELEVAGGSIQGLDLRLGPTGSITGRLLGLTPADLSAVRVGADANSRDEPGMIRPDGTYHIPGLPPGEWRVHAELPSGRQAAGTVRLEPDMPEAVLDLDLGGALSFSGVVRIDGVPRSRVSLSLESLETGQKAAQASTSSDGTFRMAHLAPGTYRWRVFDLETFTSLQRQIELSADLETAVEVTTGTVRGQALSPEGAPIAGFGVSLEGTYEDWAVISSIYVYQHGSFEWRLPAGEYRINFADSIPYSGSPFQVPAGDAATVQVVLQSRPR